MPAIGLGRISLNSQLYLFFFFFFGCTHTVCRILVPQQGMEPGPFAVRRQSPNHRTSREFPDLSCKQESKNVLCVYISNFKKIVQFSLSVVLTFATPWTAACQASLSILNSWSLLKLMSVELAMPSNHLILCRPLLFLPSIFPSIMVAKVLELQLQH